MDSASRWLPLLAVEAGLLLGTSLVTRPLVANEPARKIGLVWRRGTGRREEFRLLAKELTERAKLSAKSVARLMSAFGTKRTS